MRVGTVWAPAPADIDGPTRGLCFSQVTPPITASLLVHFLLQLIAIQAQTFYAT